MKVIKLSLAVILSLSLLSCANPTANKNQYVQSNNFKIKVIPLSSDGFNEESYYYAFNDVKSSISNNTFPNGYKHFSSLNQTDKDLRLGDSSYITAKNAVEQGFNENAYLNAFPDIANAVANGFPSGYIHYINYGVNEARLIQPAYINAKKQVKVFDTKSFVYAYRSTITGLNEDNAYQKYIDYLAETTNHTANEKFQTTEYITAYNHVILDGFDENAYLMAYDDVRNSIFLGNDSNGYTHYISKGKNQGNRLSSLYYLDAKEGFCEEAYIQTFSEIKAAINTNEIYNAHWHYHYTGKYEGRLQNPEYINVRTSVLEGFNEKSYLAAFPDIANAVNNPNSGVPSGHWHYFNYGKSEGRITRTEYINARTNFINSNKVSGSIVND